MRHPILISLCLAGVTAVSACQKATDAEVDRAIEDVNVIDESNLNDVMLTVGDRSASDAGCGTRSGRPRPSSTRGRRCSSSPAPARARPGC